MRGIIELVAEAYDKVGDLVKSGRVTTRVISDVYVTLAVVLAHLRHETATPKPPGLVSKPPSLTQ